MEENKNNPKYLGENEDLHPCWEYDRIISNLIY